VRAALIRVGESFEFDHELLIHVVYEKPQTVS
jgi:hypothetical protein